MLNRRTLFLAATCLAITPAFAADKQAFSAAAFDAAMKAGKPVLVEVHAPWCPTCKQQEPHINKLSADPKFKDLIVFKLDFDSQKDALRQLNARQQSTLIVFKGGKEVDRSVGDTDGNTIRMLVEGVL